MPETVVSRDGTRIAVWRSGKGRPLVLVHGTTADHTRWDALVPLLAPTLAPCAIDRRGRGASGDGPSYSLAREAEDVAAVVEALARESGDGVDVFGHSFGALVALEAARLAPGLRRLVLYEPSLLADPAATGFADEAEALLREGRPEAVVELLFVKILGIPEAEVAKLRGTPVWDVRVQAAHTLPREDRAEAAYRFAPDRFAALQTPALLLVGGQSRGFLRESTMALARALPTARLAELPGQEHMAISAAPDLVARAVVPFLA